MKHISPIELKEKLDRQEPCQIIDTRDSVSFSECHIDGAVNIPQIDLPEKTGLIRQDIPVIIYCMYGVKSQAPYLYLTEKMKFRNIIILQGGLYQWATEIEPGMSVA
jgi:rhodanese-related sulfurtransferase